MRGLRGTAVQRTIVQPLSVSVIYHLIQLATLGDELRPSPGRSIDVAQIDLELKGRFTRPDSTGRGAVVLLCHLSMDARLCLAPLSSNFVQGWVGLW